MTYLAVDERSPVRREVVIKIFYIRPNEDPRDKICRFVLEGLALDYLANEPGVVVQVERGQRPAQRPEEVDDAKAERIRQRMNQGRDYYMVFQYMSGGDLWQRIRRNPLPQHEALRITIAVGEALSPAHQRGLLHRDVKPHNILFDSQNNPKLADWGVARFMFEDMPQVGTVPSQRPSTPAYLPPESARDIVQEDIYALAVTFLEMLTGPLPDNSSDWPLSINKRLNRVQPPDLRAIIQKAVAKKPAQQYQDVSEMTKALRVYQQELVNKPVVRPRAWPEPPIKDVEEWLLAGVLFLIGMMVAIYVFITLFVLFS